MRGIIAGSIQVEQSTKAPSVVLHHHGQFMGGAALVACLALRMASTKASEKEKWPN